MKLDIRVNNGTLGRRKKDVNTNTLIELYNPETGKGWIIAEVNGDGDMRLFQNTIDTNQLDGRKINEGNKGRSITKLGKLVSRLFRRRAKQTI